ncbi:MAG: S8 family serine peptidase [Anaerolineae bacterium]
MNTDIRRYEVLAVLLIMVALISTSAALVTPASAAPNATPQRLLIDVKSTGDFALLRADLASSGIKVVREMPAINMMVVLAPTADARAPIARNSHVAAVAPDRIEQIVPPEFGTPTGQQTRMSLNRNIQKRPARPSLSLPPDPAFGLPGLMWNVDRIHAQQAWLIGNGLGAGFQSIKVAVEDTGLDYTHLELRNKVDKVVDFTVNEQPNICSYFFSLPTDAQLATAFGAPSSDLDFNGHGSWIGGNIAAAMNSWDPTQPYTGTNGIAPGVQLVSLKISQNCGSAYDSTILDAFIYAANNGIDIVSISFGGYLDRTDPAQDLIYRFYKRAVTYALAHGTVIVAAAGNEHTKIGAGGQVISHGILSTPPGGTDYFGLWETPGGIPGVIDVASTGNVVNAPSASCPGDSLAAGSHQWCKPTSDAHQSFGVGKMNQLTYYSNYGPRIDFSAPGGARKFNVPAIDRGGCEGWPWCGINSVEGGTSVADGYNAWEDFSITSNYATEIPCFTFTSDPVFPSNQCYAIIQGTSMATPHVSAVAAIALSTHPEAWKNPTALIAILKAGATHFPSGYNSTPGVSKTDLTPGDLGGAACTNGYCHLGGLPIYYLWAYGKYGFVDAFKTATVP